MKLENAISYFKANNETLIKIKEMVKQEIETTEIAVRDFSLKLGKEVYTIFVMIDVTTFRFSR